RAFLAPKTTRNRRFTISFLVEIECIKELYCISDHNFRCFSWSTKYENIPVSGGSDITLENAKKVRNFFSSCDNETVVIHCRSANRNGAIMALAAFAFDGKNSEEAISIGKDWGLEKLESKVRSEFEHMSSTKH
ncbi:hypothetical protein JQC92_08230, partial [Shewanella sp. 202IG2-18]|nr:hypothetical protein [Parashewanella hymeniacidonis]